MSPSATLYYTPTSCGAANFIAAHKAGLIGTKLNAVEVDILTHRILTGPNAGDDYYRYNPKGNVPTIIDDGIILNENVATLTYIADLAGNDLAPAYGTKERYTLLNYLSLIATEIHKGIYGPLFAGADKEATISKGKVKLAFLDSQLKGKTFLVGEKFTVADSYLYIVLTWSMYVGVDLTNFPNLQNFHQFMSQLDFIKAGHQAMAAMSPKD